MTSTIIARLTTRGLIGDARTVALEYRVELEDMVGRSDDERATAARHELWRRIVAVKQLSYREIAALFDRHHTGIMYGCEAARKRRQ